MVVLSGTGIPAPVGNVADVTMVAPDTEVELARLRAQLAEFQDNVVTKRPRVRQRVGGGGPMLSMLTLVCASEWMVTVKPICKKRECRRQCAGVDWVCVVSFTRSCGGVGCGASERRVILVHPVRVQQKVRWRPRDQVPQQVSDVSAHVRQERRSPFDSTHAG